MYTSRQASFGNDIQGFSTSSLDLVDIGYIDPVIISPLGVRVGLDFGFPGVRR